MGAGVKGDPLDLTRGLPTRDDPHTRVLAARYLIRRGRGGLLPALGLDDLLEEL